MPIVDATELADGSRIRADVCVIGAGAAGITLASELDGSALDVCLLESGGFKVDEAVQALYELENVGYPIRANFMSRARYLGGSCNLWAGRTMKLSPIDLEQRAWVPYSGWPLAYEELERYYPRAERVLRLPPFSAFAFADGLPSMSADERALLAEEGLCPTVALWGTKPLRFGNVYRRMLRVSRNVTTYLNASATELRAGPDGRRLEGVSAKTLAGRRLDVEARCYVLAAGGLESARLMLVSRGQHRDGLANAYGLVGRFFQDHPRAIFGRVRLERPVSLPYVLGMPIGNGKIQLGLRLADELQRRDGLLNSYVSLEPQLSKLAEQQYETAINAAKVLLKKGHAGSRGDLFRRDRSDLRDVIYLLTPKEIMPHFVYRIYAWLKRRVRRTIAATHLTVINYCEQAPNPQSRVYLSDEKDALGLQRLVLDWRMSEQELESLRRLHEVLGRAVRRAGLGTLEADAEALGSVRFTDASHHIGTLRMASDPTRGVVDEHCRAYGIDNLFVAGSAVFPTAGHANPTLTIVALALRLADRLRAGLS